MRVGMVLYDPQEVGGLEEYSVTLAICLHRAGHDVSVVSATWTDPANQYIARLREAGIPFEQPARWMSRAGSDWPTKERILERTVDLLAPVTATLGLARAVRLRTSWSTSHTSARNWLRGQLSTRLVAQDRRPQLGRMVLERWRRQWRPDVLHVQGYTSTLLFAVAWAHGHRLPVVYEEHQTPDPRFDWWNGFGAVVNLASIVVAVSETSKEALATHCGITRPIVTRPPLCADPLAAGWRRPARAPGAPVRLTTVARLAETKGIEYLLEAIARVRPVHPGAEFRVYGNGPLREELLSRAAALGLDGETILAGPFTSREELARIMADTDVFVMPSVLEGQPLGLVEAMAHQCPIIATPVGGIPELIRDGENGLLCAPRDAEALAWQIATLIDDAAMRDRLGLAARRSYEHSRFKPESVSEHMLAIYAEAVAAGVPGAGS